MLIIVLGSKSSGSLSYKVAGIYRRLLQARAVKSDIFSLSELPSDFIMKHVNGSESADFKKIMEDRIIPENKFVFVVPEYNGSIPGILKTFIDTCDIDRCFKGKKAALVGISAGRAGNLRGLDHLTDILHHIGAEVLSRKIPISSINKILTPAGEFESPDTEKVLENQIELFLKF
jgi:chromate reductase, NAD(P)H dehydrogenase (quinone)